MISIDEAILHARQVAENKRADKRKVQNKPDEYRACEKCAEEHDQLADWLEELKAYRANEGMSENVYKAGYKKAMRDCTNTTLDGTTGVMHR